MAQRRNRLNRVLAMNLRDERSFQELVSEFNRAIHRLDALVEEFSPMVGHEGAELGSIRREIELTVGTFALRASALIDRITDFEIDLKASPLTSAERVAQQAAWYRAYKQWEAEQAE